MWKKEKIEEVKKFRYLGYTLTRDNKNNEHIKEQVAKARKGKRCFAEDWKKRKLMFEALCKSVYLYGVEIWGFEKYEEVERIKKKYLKFVFELDRNTPDYVVRREFKECSMYVETINRAVKY